VQISNSVQTELRTLSFALAAALIVASGAVSGDTQDAAAAKRSQDGAGVYRVALEQRYHGGVASRFPVTDIAIAMPLLTGAWSKGLGAFEGVPAELRGMASQQTPAALLPIQASMLPPGVRIVPAATKADPKASWISVSQVLYTRDGLDALVYADAYCGSLCAEDAYVWVHRETHSSPWRLARRITRRVS
jgi:hypothetical protein